MVPRPLRPVEAVDPAPEDVAARVEARSAPPRALAVAGNPVVAHGGVAQTPRET